MVKNWINMLKFLFNDHFSAYTCLFICFVLKHLLMLHRPMLKLPFVSSRSTRLFLPFWNKQQTKEMWNCHLKLTYIFLFFEFASINDKPDISMPHIITLPPPKYVFHMCAGNLQCSLCLLIPQSNLGGQNVDSFLNTTLLNGTPGIGANGLDRKGSCGPPHG